MKIVSAKSLPYLLLLIAMATYFYAPAFFQGKSQIHGDGIINGLALLDLHHRVLQAERDQRIRIRPCGGRLHCCESAG